MSNIHFDFSDKVVLVTGGRRGLGKAVAKAFYQAGAQVIILSKSPNQEQILENYLYLQIDLTKREQRDNIINTIVDKFGKIDILINNAGRQYSAPVLNYDINEWDTDIELMLTAIFDLSKQSIKHMINQGGGKIINISSISGFQGAKNISSYSTVKHALIGLTKCLSNEFAINNININAIAPGIIITDMTASLDNNNPQTEVLKSRIPAGRFANVEDIVGPVLFLASDAANFINGTTLVVDGGWLGR